MNVNQSDKSPVCIGLLGLGNVGTGFVESIRANNDLSEKLIIKKILVKDLTKSRSLAIPDGILTSNISDIIEDSDIDIVVEVLGGEFPAAEYIEQAFMSGKHVVTANKEAVAKHGAELARTSHEHNRQFMFEASVGGGVPVINALIRDLAANQIASIKAIINGTTNYILTQMTDYSSGFSEALTQAQQLGYAEPDPANDIEGIDSTYKIAIMASLAFSGSILVDSIYREGITKLDARDFRYAHELGYSIKLLAIARRITGEVEIRVHPTLIPEAHPLAKVDGVFNAVYIEGDLVGPLLLQGRGAGPEPTSSALLSDVLAIAAATSADHGQLNPVLGQQPIAIRSIEQLLSGYYLRMQVLDEPGVLHQIASVFANLDISIASVIQKESDEIIGTAEIVVTTHESVEADIQVALRALMQQDCVNDIGACIRIDL